MSRLLYYLILLPIAALPPSIRYGLSNALAWILQYVAGYRRKLIKKNLKLCFPDKSAEWRKSTEKLFYRNLADIILESVSSFNLSEDEAAKRVSVKNHEVLQELFEKGKSIIITGGHNANWEAITVTGNEIPHDTYALYKPLKNEFMDSKVKKSREQLGVSMISVKDYRRFMTGEYERPRAFIFGIDQSPRKDRGIWMQFLNRKSLVFTGPERLSKEFDLAIVSGKIKRKNRGRYEVIYELLFEDPRSTEEEEITRATMKAVEELTMTAPHEWLWSHNRWKH